MSNHVQLLSALEQMMSIGSLQENVRQHTLFLAHIRQNISTKTDLAGIYASSKWL